ncbi:MAG: peptide chain release factor N(5)-glutamine methyltransferase [Phycisphaerae bacterium]
MTNEPWTVLKLINWTKEFFARNNVDSPRLAAEILLAHVLGCSRIDLYARFNHEPTPDQLKQFRQMVKRAQQHEPVAYLLGEKEFYSLGFKVTPDVLIPRPETEIVVTEATRYLRSLGRPGTMWDLGTGSGCIAIATARQVDDVKVLATDISEGAVSVARENAERHDLADRVRVRQADLLALPEDCDDLRPFDVITANLPYVRQSDPIGASVKHEPKVALYGGDADGLSLIRRMAPQLPSMIAPEGVLIMEFGIDQGDDIRDLISDTDEFTEPQILRDLNDLERILVAYKL